MCAAAATLREPARIGGDSTRNLTNKITLNITDASGVAQMRFHNDSGQWTSWEPYATTKTWTLREAQGERTVFGQFRDKKGNETAEMAIKDTIEYDTVSPSMTMITPAPGSHNVPLDANTNITFNDDMNAASLENNVFIRRCLGGTRYEAVGADVTYYASSRTVVLNPKLNLKANSDYVVSVLGGSDGGGAKDTAYNEIDQDPDKPGTQGDFWHLFTD